MDHDEDLNHNERKIWEELLANSAERKAHEVHFRRGACHAIAGAERIAAWYGPSAASIIGELQNFAQVLDDWRCGITEQLGFQDNPWTWEQETYEAYIKMQGPQW